MAPFIIRMLLTIWLIYGVYTETGVWTAFAFTLCMVSLELISASIKNVLATLNIIGDAMDQAINILKS